jgi:hypothetical protein
MQTTDVSSAHAASNVLRLDGPAGARAFLKSHRQLRKFHQELHALERWGVQLKRTPRVLAARIEPSHTLLLSNVAGVVVEGALFDRPTLLEVQRQAGVYLRQLHSLQHLDHDISLADALSERLDRWSIRAARFVNARTIAAIGDRVREVDLRAYRRVPTHRDFGPRNWLWDTERSQLNIIDFEHALPDFWWVDVNRLVDEAWWGEPRLEEAFWEGYGRSPSEEERHIGVAWRAMTALGTIAWARAHNDVTFEAQGWVVLRRLGFSS